MARWRPDDYETPTVDAAAGFEHYYGEGTVDDDTLARRDAKRDGTEDAFERFRQRQAEREGRAA